MQTFGLLLPSQQHGRLVIEVKCFASAVLIQDFGQVLAKARSASIAGQYSMLFFGKACLFHVQVAEDGAPYLLEVNRVLFWSTPRRSLEERKESCLKVIEQFNSVHGYGKPVLSNDPATLPLLCSLWEPMDREFQMNEVFQPLHPYFNEFFKASTRGGNQEGPLWYQPINNQPLNKTMISKILLSGMTLTSWIN